MGYSSIFQQGWQLGPEVWWSSVLLLTLMSTLLPGCESQRVAPNQVSGGYGGSHSLPILNKGHVVQALAPQVDPLQWLRRTIPGEPGVDYPIFTEVGYNDFACHDKVFGGYYADTKYRCQGYHVCLPSPVAGVPDRKMSFICPNGTVFNQEIFACDWWFNVDCSHAESFYAFNAKIGDRSAKIGGRTRYDPKLSPAAGTSTTSLPGAPLPSGYSTRTSKRHIGSSPAATNGNKIQVKSHNFSSLDQPSEAFLHSRDQLNVGNILGNGTFSKEGNVRPASTTSSSHGWRIFPWPQVNIEGNRETLSPSIAGSYSAFGPNEPERSHQSLSLNESLLSELTSLYDSDLNEGFQRGIYEEDAQVGSDGNYEESLLSPSMHQGFHDTTPPIFGTRLFGA